VVEARNALVNPGTHRRMKLSPEADFCLVNMFHLNLTYIVASHEAEERRIQNQRQIEGMK
jgi:hypothetical protein